MVGRSFETCLGRGFDKKPPCTDRQTDIHGPKYVCVCMQVIATDRRGQCIIMVVCLTPQTLTYHDRYIHISVHRFICFLAAMFQTVLGENWSIPEVTSSLGIVLPNNA